MQVLGRLSYGWYLWHWPVLLIGPVAVGASGKLWQKLVLAAGALVLAWCSYRWVESPLRHRAALRRSARRGLGLGLGLSTTVAAVAVLLVLLPHAVPVGRRSTDLRTALNHTAQPAAVLAQAIADSHTRRKLPANLTPKLTRASRDRPAVWNNGCHADIPVTRVPTGCVFGDPAGATTVVLFGDSHAAQWFPAMERIAVRRHWRLVALSKSSCSAVDVVLRHASLKREYGECTAFHRSAMARIRQLHPALVVIGTSFNYEPARPEKNVTAQWQAGWGRTFDELTADGARVAAIEDTPYMGSSVPECLAEQTDIGKCTRSRRSALRGPAQRRAFLTYAGSPRATVIHPLDWFCDGTCPPVIGNVLVYRDSNHLTTTYSALLAPLLEAALPALPEKAGASGAGRPGSAGSPGPR
jgi:hypothetical protein